MSNLRLSSRIQVLSLYRNLQHEARNFKNYNFREYAKRRIRDGFKENKNIQDPNKIQVLLKEGNEQLVSLRRQTLLDSLYHSHPPLVVEKRTR